MHAELLVAGAEVAGAAERIGADERPAPWNPGGQLTPKARIDDADELDARPRQLVDRDGEVRDAEERRQLGRVALVAVEQLDDPGRLAQLRDAFERRLPGERIEEPDAVVTGHRVRRSPHPLVDLPAEPALELVAEAELGARIVPGQKPLCIRPARGTEVADDGAGVRAADSPGVGGECLLAERLPVLPVRRNEMRPRDVPGREEEGEADPARDLEQGAILARGLEAEALVDERELLLGRKLSGSGPELFERGPELLELERRQVDQPRGSARRAFEHAEELVDRADVGVRRNHARGLQLLDELAQIDAGAARNVRGRGKQPERRKAEGEDRPELDDVAGSLAHRDLAGRHGVGIGG